jgi:hypothetical protein
MFDRLSSSMPSTGSARPLWSTITSSMLICVAALIVATVLFLLFVVQRKRLEVEDD